MPDVNVFTPDYGGRDMEAVERALSSLEIETPSWGYGDSGTRFATFQQPGRPRDVFERLDDAAEVHRLTGTAPAVALHFPWDAVEDFGGLRAHIEGLGLRGGARVDGPVTVARGRHELPRTGRSAQAAPAHARRPRTGVCGAAREPRAA